MQSKTSWNFERPRSRLLPICGAAVGWMGALAGALMFDICANPLHAAAGLLGGGLMLAFALFCAGYIREGV